MLNHQFRKLNSVQVSDNLILVGERHYDARSEGLLQSVLCSLDDLGAVAIERNRPSIGFHSETAMDRAEEYASKCDIPRYYIDKSSDWLYNQIGGSIEYADTVISDGNEFTVEPQANGNIDVRAICDARNRIYHTHGRDAFDALFTDREKCMAKYLNWIKEHTDGSVVVAVGVFHIFALLDFMDMVDSEKPTEVQPDDGIGELLRLS